MNGKRAVGAAGEAQAAEYLAAKGYRILERNYTVRGGEADLIAQVGDQTVFVEVKVRNSETYGTAAEAVTLKKQQRVTRTALHYLAAHPEAAAHGVRFDVITISDGRLTHYESAFDAAEIKY